MPVPSTKSFFLNPTSIGSSSHFTPIAGPCAVESYEQLEKTAKVLKKNHIHLLRGGLWKLRTSHQSFQGVGEEGLEWLQAICHDYQLGFVTEITDLRQLELLEKTDFVSAFQVGTRNMYNYPLLKELGKTQKPVLLKRSFSATLKEWLQAAEYIVNGGNEKVILCERGIRTFENSTRYTLDINTVVYLKHHCPFPVVVDPSHAIGIRELVPALCYTSIAAGADGLLVEVHPAPPQAKSDSAQALHLSTFEETLFQMQAYLVAAKKTFSPIAVPSSFAVPSISSASATPSATPPPGASATTSASATPPPGASATTSASATPPPGASSTSSASSIPSPEAKTPC